jgi:hypothetical protein
MDTTGGAEMGTNIYSSQQGRPHQKPSNSTTRTVAELKINNIQNSKKYTGIAVMNIQK